MCTDRLDEVYIARVWTLYALVYAYWLVATVAGFSQIVAPIA